MFVSLKSTGLDPRHHSRPLGFHPHFLHLAQSSFRLLGVPATHCRRLSLQSLLLFRATMPAALLRLPKLHGRPVWYLYLAPCSATHYHHLPLIILGLAFQGESYPCSQHQFRCSIPLKIEGCWILSWIQCHHSPSPQGVLSICLSAVWFLSSIPTFLYAKSPSCFLSWPLFRTIFRLVFGDPRTLPFVFANTSFFSIAPLAPLSFSLCSVGGCGFDSPSLTCALWWAEKPKNNRRIRVDPVPDEIGLVNSGLHIILVNFGLRIPLGSHQATVRLMTPSIPVHHNQPDTIEQPKGRLYATAGCRKYCVTQFVVSLRYAEQIVARRILQAVKQVDCPEILTNNTVVV